MSCLGSRSSHGSIQYQWVRITSCLDLDLDWKMVGSTDTSGVNAQNQAVKTTLVDLQKIKGSTWDNETSHPLFGQNQKKTPLIQRQYGLKTSITLNIYLGTFNPADRFRKINFPFGGLWYGPCQGSPLAQPLDTCPTFTPEHTRHNHIKPSLQKSVENWFFLPPPKYYMFQSKYLHHHLIHSCHGWFQPKDQSEGSSLKQLLNIEKHRNISETTRYVWIIWMIPTTVAASCKSNPSRSTTPAKVEGASVANGKCSNECGTYRLVPMC